MLPFRKKKKKEKGTPIEGRSARPRLDRPGRKKMADGGWSGEGDSGKDLREKGNSEDSEGKREVRKGEIKSVLGGALTGFGRGILGRGIGIGAGLSGVSDIGSGLERFTKARHMYEQADKAEGRKSGGRTGKKG